MGELKVGDKVKVYQKPITREDYEGIATLIELIRLDERDGLNRWLVHFQDDEPGSNYVRTIYTG